MSTLAAVVGRAGTLDRALTTDPSLTITSSLRERRKTESMQRKHWIDPQKQCAKCVRANNEQRNKPFQPRPPFDLAREGRGVRHGW